MGEDIREIRWLWLSKDNMTCGVSINKKGMIEHTPPILRKFKGQNIKNLIKWMKSEGFKGVLLKDEDFGDEELNENRNKTNGADDRKTKRIK